MKKHLLASLSSLLFPMSIYGLPFNTGSYQRSYLRASASSGNAFKLSNPAHSITPATLFPESEDQIDINEGRQVLELVIIDAAVPEKHEIYKQSGPGVEIVELRPGENGLVQLKNILSGYRNLNALHIFSHAEDAKVYLGNSVVTREVLSKDINTLAVMDQALKDGADVYFYGCSLAKTQEGESFLDLVSHAANVDVAASNNYTGGHELGGDWNLEIQKGDINKQPRFDSVAMSDFNAILRFSGTLNLDDMPTGYTNSKSYTIDGTSYAIRVQSGDGSNGIYNYSAGYVYVAAGYSTNTTSTVDFTGGQTFSLSSLYLFNSNGVSTKTFRVTSNKGGVQDSGAVDEGTGTTVNFSGANWTDITSFTIQYTDNTTMRWVKLDNIVISDLGPPRDSDATLTAAAGVTEPVGLGTTVDTVGEAVDVFDFTIADGGTADGLSTLISALAVNVSGTSTDAERDQITWRLNGPDAPGGVTGTYSAGTITFSGLSINVANGGNETYTVNAYYNDNTGLTEDHTIILSIDGDTNLTVGSDGTRMGSTTAVTNGTGTTIDVAATQLVFTTQPAGSVSGVALTQQPVVAARDAANNTDVDFTETVTLTEGSAGTLTNNTQAASNGVATFTNLIYTATADQQSFTLTADDQASGSNLPTTNSNSVTSNVVATKLVFDTQPAPTTIAGNQSTVFSAIPVVSARDASDIVDTGYSTGITLSEVNGPGSAALAATGDTDGNALTVTVTPGSGVSTFSGMQINYTMSGSSDETFNLRASSGGLTTADSDQFTAVANNPPTDVALSANNINQSSTVAAAVVGTLSTTDADGGDTHTYSLVANGASGNGSCGAAGDDDNTSFQIDNSNDELETAGSLSPGSYNVCIQTSDGAASYQETFSITVVDNVAPTVSSVSVPANATYITGQNLNFTVNTSENVTVNTTGGTPQISLTIGSTTRQAAYLSGSGTSALVFRYTVQAGDNDTNGIAVAAAIDANSGTLRDSGGNDLNTTLNSVGSTASVLVDAVAPTVSSVSVPANGTYVAGQNLDFTVNTSENVTVNTTGGTPQISLTIGSTTRQAAYLSGSGTSALVFRYTVQAGDNDTNGIAVAAAVDLSGGTLKDGAGNDLNTTLNSVGSTVGVLVDAVAPTVSSVSVPSNGTYIAGQNLDLTVNTNENVTVNTTGGTPEISLTIGATTRQAVYLGGSGTSALVFRYTVQSGDNDTDGIAVGTLSVNGGTLRDGAGNNLNTTLNSVGSTASVLVDAVAPTISSVSVPANGTYTAGQNLDFTVNYDEVVTVDTTGGTPRLVLTIGTTTQHANFVGGSGTAALLFRYTVQAGDKDANGIALSGTLDLNGGTIRDSFTNNASTSLSGIGSLASVLVDAGGPAAVSVSLLANGTYTAGQNLDFTVTYDENATVTGTPRLALTIGSTTRHATYQSGSGGTALLFSYTVQAGDNDADGISLSSTLDLNGGTIRDSVANDASTDLGAIASLAAVLVDTQAPAIATNTGLSVGEGLSAVIGGTRLSATDNISSGTAVVFTVTAVPVNGVLRLSGGDLSNNDTFTQDDIDNNRVTYEHDGSVTTSDSFDFNVRDAVNNTAATGTFNITIAPPEEPIITAPADLDIDATGLYTSVTLRQLLGLAANASDAAVQAARLALASDAADGSNCCNPVALGLSNGSIRLAPGAHTITWRATDSEGNTTDDTQTVNVHPLVSMAKDQTGVEGGLVELRIILNGLSPVYPLDVPYIIDAAQSSAVEIDDFDPLTGIATFNAGETETSVAINLIPDAPEGDEVLVVRLDDSLVNVGATVSQRITITEGNLAPAVTLDLDQNGVVTTLVTPSGGTVTVTAAVDDPNVADAHTYNWSMSDSGLVDIDGNTGDAVFEFNPSSLTPGVRRLHVAVNDGAATATATLNFRVVAQLPALGTADADADGVNDQTEGADDGDKDGIPDYLDHIRLTANVLPETVAQINAYLVECDPGVSCRLGRSALVSIGGGASLAPADLVAQGIESDEGYEHVGGVFDFEAQGLPVAGQSVRVAIPLQAPIPMGAVYRKFQNGQWDSFVEDADNALHSAAGEAGYCPPPGDAAWQSGLNAGHLCVQLTLQDGGPNDADGLADGSVEDPGAIATEEVDEVIEVYPIRIKVKGAGGGGAADGFFLAVLALLALLRIRRAGKSLAGALLLLLLPVQARAVDWNALFGNTYLELGLFQADGSHSRGDLIEGLADEGIATDVRVYDVSRTAWQLSAGYQYHEYFAVRFGYLDLGEATVDLTASTAVSTGVLADSIERHYPISAYGWVVANRFEYPVYERLKLAVDAGLYRWRSEIAAIDSMGRDIDTEKQGDTDPLLGISANYRLTDRYGAGLGWQRVFFGGQEVDLWGVSGTLHF